MTRDRSATGEPGERPDWDTIARVLADESSAEEGAAMRQWLAEHPSDAELLTALDRSLDRVAAPSDQPIDVEAALSRVIARRDAPDVRPLPTRVGRTPALGRRSRWGRRAAEGAAWAAARRAAAIVAVAAVGAFAIWLARRPDARPSGAARTYATSVGQRDSVRLPDGSRVLLAPGSELLVASDFGNPRREVELRGEGYFDVRHDDAHAFTVRAGSAVIRDIGTVFTVRVREAGRVRVVVSEGAVLLDATSDRAIGNGRGVVLHQGDVGELAPSGPVAQRGTATDDDVAWTRGRLVFRDALVTDVAVELRRWYGVELVVADPTLAGRHITSTLLVSESRQHVVQTIAATLGGTVTWKGDSAIVRAASGGR
jgi:transmembrane sensor